MNPAPIILFVYNRPEHTLLTLNSLKKNELARNSKLFIYSDGPKSQSDTDKVNHVRSIIRKVNGFLNIEIFEKENNQGLAASIISGVSEVLDRNESVIVLEDDIVTSLHFLDYMNKLLQFYVKDSKICSVTGYTFPIKFPPDYKYDIYLSPRASSWGWGTWRNRWKQVDWVLKDFDNFVKSKSLQQEFNRAGNDLSKMLINQKHGKIDSWSIIWSYHHFKNDAFCVYPTKSKVRNIGADLSGIHTGRTKKYDVKLDDSDNSVKLIQGIEANEQILAEFQKFFRKNYINSIYNKIKKI